jgi:hypothetical protein
MRRLPHAIALSRRHDPVPHPRPCRAHVATHVQAAARPLLLVVTLAFAGAAAAQLPQTAAPSAPTVAESLRPRDTTSRTRPTDTSRPSPAKLPASGTAPVPIAAVDPDARFFVYGITALLVVACGICLYRFVDSALADQPLFEGHWGGFGGGASSWRISPAVLFLVATIALGTMVTAIATAAIRPAATSMGTENRAASTARDSAGTPAGERR